MSNLYLNEDKVYIAGVYEIRNKKTGAIYIGESVNVFRRQTEHIRCLFLNTHHNKNLQADFNEYGSKYFDFNLIYILDTKDMDKNTIKNYLLYLESAFYKKYESTTNLYNILNPYMQIYKETVKLVDDYNIDFKVIRKLLDDDPLKIGYEPLFPKKANIYNSPFGKLTEEEDTNYNIYFIHNSDHTKLKQLDDHQNKLIYMLAQSNKIQIVKRKESPIDILVIKKGVPSDYIVQLDEKKPKKDFGKIRVDKKIFYSDECTVDVKEFLMSDEVVDFCNNIRQSDSYKGWYK